MIPTWITSRSHPGFNWSAGHTPSRWALQPTSSMLTCTSRAVPAAGPVSDDGRPAMNAGFFVLAVTAAFNPKLLGADLLLIENRRPRAMFLCVLLGGLTVGITIGLLDVLVFHLDAISSQKTVSAGVDLALGLLLLAVGGLVATGRLHARRKAKVPAGGDIQPDKPEKK